ncbi:MAG: hypothetical protein PHN53_06195, partial [Eubacteriales bacterium]|nr:hypothetical protein [Eubacteriales bacterium]
MRFAKDMLALDRVHDIMLNRRFAPARLCKAATRQDERVGIMKHALVIGILVICLALAGCGPAATTSTSHSTADKGYGLAVSGLTLYCHDDMAPILAGLVAAGRIVSGDTLDVFVCHWPSRSGGQRESEP